MNKCIFVFGIVIGQSIAASAIDMNGTVKESLRSPNGLIEVSVVGGKGSVSYSVRLSGETIVRPSSLGLMSEPDRSLEIVEVSRSSGDETWKPAWGIHSEIRDHYNEVQLKVEGPSAQTIILRAYDDGVAFRYAIPDGRTFSDKAYAHEATQISFVSEQPKAWFPLSQVLVSDETDLNTWEPAKEGEGETQKNVRYDFKPAVIRTPFTLKLSEKAYISVHEAAVIQSDIANLRLTENTLTYNSKINAAGGQVTSWRTISIAEHPGELIESTLLVNLNEPSKIKDTSWIKPGVTLWDWRNHGAQADDGFEYHINTESYIRYIDFAAEAGVEYVLIDAEWYGPERDLKSDPKTAIPEVDIEKVCAHAKSKGVGMWLYLNTKALQKFDMDATFKQFREWSVVGIKQGFSAAANRKAIEFDLGVVKKCAEYGIMHVRHESAKPTGVTRTYPNILSYEYVNSMLDSATRPSATPSRVISGLFVFGLAGPVDRSCGMFDLDSYITREKCHRQIPSTVVSQVAQCLLYPSGLLTLPDMPDAYRRKADLFEFIGELPMNWDETKVLEAEIGKHISLARRAGQQWFVGSLADEQGRKTSVTLDFLEDGVHYDVTLYEDAPDAHYEYIGPMNKQEARATKTELKPQKTRRELYQVKKITAQKGDSISVTIAPGGGHCMWIRPQGPSQVSDAKQLASQAELYIGKEYSRAYANPEDNPNRPNVLLIGDSISIGYTVEVRKRLKEKADVFRIPENGEDAAHGLEKLDKWLGTRKWDVIHFNWGLWDICYRNPESKTQGHRDKVNGTLTATPDQYRETMERIVERLKETGAILIWCTTTPVPEGEAGRKLGDDIKYNQVAAEIMNVNGVLINDLHAHALLKLPDIQVREGDVHFTMEGYKHLAEKVAQEVSSALSIMYVN